MVAHSCCQEHYRCRLSRDKWCSADGRDRGICFCSMLGQGGTRGLGEQGSGVAINVVWVCIQTGILLYRGLGTYQSSPSPQSVHYRSDRAWAQCFPWKWPHDVEWHWVSLSFTHINIHTLSLSLAHFFLQTLCIRICSLVKTCTVGIQIASSENTSS